MSGRGNEGAIMEESFNQRRGTGQISPLLNVRKRDLTVKYLLVNGLKESGEGVSGEWVCENKRQSINLQCLIDTEPGGLYLICPPE